MSAKIVRVLIAEDHGTVRAGLRLLIEKEPDMEVVGEAADGREALLLALKLLPDVVLMDISMPGVDGLQATRGLRESCPQVRVLAPTRHADYGFLTVDAAGRNKGLRAQAEFVGRLGKRGEGGRFGAVLPRPRGHGQAHGRLRGREARSRGRAESRVPATPRVRPTPVVSCFR